MHYIFLRLKVALCEEGVDRNVNIAAHSSSDGIVALCEEGVDRNSDIPPRGMAGRVALCEEGVDRNLSVPPWVVRRRVALCEEGVDRNSKSLVILGGLLVSPSAKRAWIEIHDRPAAVSAGCRRPLRRGRG